MSLVKDIFSLKSFIVLNILLSFLVLKGPVGNMENAADFSDRGITMALGGANNNSRYFTTLAIYKGGIVDMTMDYADKATPDIGYYKGSFYSFFPLGMSLLALPFYAIGYPMEMGQVSISILCELIYILGGILLYLYCRDGLKMSERNTFFVATFFQFATFSLTYSTRLLQHNIFIVFLFGILYLSSKILEGRTRKITLILIGCIYGISIFFDYPNILLLSPALLYCLLLVIHENIFSTLKEKIKALLCILIPIVFIFSIAMFSNYLLFDHPLQTSNRLPQYKGFNYEYLAVNSDDIIEQKRNVFQIFGVENLPKGLEVIFFEKDKGIFFFAPILLFGLYLLFKKLFKEPNREVFILSLIVILNIFLYALSDIPSGGWTVGNRYMLPTVAILSIFLGKYLFEYRTKKNIYFNIFVYILVFYSIVNSVVLALTNSVIDPDIYSTFWGIKNFDDLIGNNSISFYYGQLQNLMPLWIYCLLIVGCISYFIFYALHDIWKKPVNK